jgi:cold-inducible RNA-binding protein
VKNIFVGNLSFSTSEDELRQIFESFGQVDRVSIMTDRDTGRSRGFGFVEMASNDDGEKAITALNGSQVGGRTLNVNEARPKTEHLNILNITFDHRFSAEEVKATLEALADYFRGCGGAGLSLEFEHEESAILEPVDV